MSPESERFWLRNPVDLGFRINSRFNDPRQYTNNPTKRQAHEGIDLHAVNSSGQGVRVLAAQRGVVEKVGNFPPGYGNYVRMRHDWPDGSTYVTWYGHLARADVREGEFLAAGAPLGIAGNTGFSFGIHLHLTLQHIGHGLKNYVVDDVIDPEPFFRSGAPRPVMECGFLADVTIPDGTTLQPGQTFPKTWRIRNNGTRKWASGDVMAFFDGDPMGDAGRTVALPKLKPGEEGEVTVDMVAPPRAGRYRSTWKPRDKHGSDFPFDMYAEIVVASAREVGGRFLADVTVPDGTQVAPREIFLKTWRVQNTGTTSWSNGYSLGFFGDAQMGAPDSLPVPPAKAGETVEISVSLRAPDDPGSHQTTWRLRDPSGQFFGDALFALVEVVPSAPSPAKIDRMIYVNDVTIPDGTRLDPRQQFDKVWRVRNSGTSTWEDGYEFVFSSGEQMGAPDAIPLPPAQPGQTVDIRLPLIAPDAKGLHRSVWEPRNPVGDIFPFEMFAEIEVIKDLEAGDVVDEARFVRDVTIQPGAVRRAGESTLKFWRVRNTGSSSWGPGYQVVFESGEAMDGEAVDIPPVEPGAEVNVSARLTMPLNPGHYEAVWRLKNPAEDVFGEPLPVSVVVPSPIPATNRRHGGAVLLFETFKPGSEVSPGEEIQVKLRVRNTGNTTWENGFSLVHEEGESYAWTENQPLPDCPPLKSVQLALNLKMPDAEGDYSGVWRLRSPEGKLFGSRIKIELKVADS